MKLLTLLFVCSTATPSTYGKNLALISLTNKINARYALLTPKQRRRAPPAPKLAKHLLNIKYLYGLKPELMLSIIAHESGFNPRAYNKRTKDYGLMQINIKTAQAYEINNECILDWECSLLAGARILYDFKRHYFKKEKHWYVRYNIGTTSDQKKVSIRGAKYRRLIQRQMVLL